MNTKGKKEFWIRVSKRLPNHSRNVIVWNGVKKMCYEDYYTRSETECSGWANSIQPYITHWMNKEDLIKLIRPPKYIIKSFTPQSNTP